MSCLAVIISEAEVGPMVRWGYRFASSSEVDFTVFVPRGGRTAEEPRSFELDAEDESDAIPFLGTIRETLRECIGAEDGPELSRRPMVEIRGGIFPDRVEAVLQEATRCRAGLLLVPKTDPERVDRADARFARQIFRHSSCTTILLRPGDSDGKLCRRILVPAAGGRNSLVALRLGLSCVRQCGGKLIPLYIEPDADDIAREVGEQYLEQVLRRAGMGSDPDHVSPRVRLAGDLYEGIAEEVNDGYDLVIIGSTNVGTIRRKLFGTVPDRLLTGHDALSVGVIRCERPFTERFREWLERWLTVAIPQMSRGDRIRVFEGLQSSSRWNFDFLALMALSTSIAALGLIADSAAIVIGAMLVAPLMSPLLGASLALVQGNFPLIRSASRAIVLGFFVALLIGAVIAWLVPGAGMTSELLARGGPTLLDMAVAFFSGMAAAYCTARPTLSAALPGVAIAAALVPPIATTGISLAGGEVDVAQGSAILFATNVVCIILGGMIAFFAGGVRGYRGRDTRPAWVRRTLIALVLAAAVLAVPLGSLLLARFAPSNPGHTEISAALKAEFVEHLSAVPGMDYVAADATLVEGTMFVEMQVSTSRIPTTELAENLARIAREHFQRPVTVRLLPQVVVEGSVRKESTVERIDTAVEE
jgi:uncharacterized hydrophobic protein (TIGR00271 family)